VGANAEYVTDGMTGYLASNNNEWVHQISKLVENAELRRQMANASRKHVEKFDFRVTGIKLCQILTEFMAKTEPGPK
jgi:glycosyltransferase involved in cell wall biosynthesis